MRWVLKKSAKHLTPASIRKRIAREQEHLRILESTGFSDELAKARKAHFDLIQVLSERLARAKT